VTYRDEDEEHDRRREEGRHPVFSREIDDDLWMMIHECRGKTHRTFVIGGFHETWTLCQTCGNWWLNSVVDLRCIKLNRLGTAAVRHPTVPIPDPI